MVSSDRTPDDGATVSPSGSPGAAPGGPSPTPRPLAFYLPQFHPIPENNVFWGDGFTEWGNVARARPLFPGHYQPRLPADLGFYDLRLPETREAQAELAREHGIYGFVYYHYWFRGQRVLERPFQEVLDGGRPDFPFCLCWANHNWTWRRENKDRARLMSQEYSEEDDREHIRWLLDAFADERYIRVNGRPLLLVYMAPLLPDHRRTFDTWRREAQKAGVPEPYICKVESVGNFQDPKDFGCDASVEFWPHGMDRVVGEPRILEENGRVNKITEYADMVEAHLKRERPPFKRYPCIVPQWDNTARFKPTGVTLLHNSTPELYGRWMRGVVEKFAGEPPDEQLVFINAWNEWGEGAYMEPDYVYGRAYLQANRRALEAAGVQVPTAPRTSGGKGEIPPPAPAEELYHRLEKKYAQLQKRHFQLMAAEEHSPLVQKLERQVEALQAHNDELKKHSGFFRSERDKLIRQMRGVNRNLSALFNSPRWKIGDTVVTAGRRVLGRSGGPTAKDGLNEIIAAFQRSEREREERKKAEGANPNGKP